MLSVPHVRFHLQIFIVVLQCNLLPFEEYFILIDCFVVTSAFHVLFLKLELLLIIHGRSEDVDDLIWCLYFHYTRT